MSKDLPEYELLSAYLDGELTTDERTRVEQLLADSPEARQLLEEMRALTSTLRALPVYKLQEDLGPRVLRMAERRMLSPATPEERSAPAAAEPASVAGESIRRRLLHPRMWLWPGIAMAVAIALWMRGSEVERPLAERQLATARRANAPAEPASMQAPKDLAEQAQPASASPPAEERSVELAESEVSGGKTEADKLTFSKSTAGGQQEQAFRRAGEESGQKPGMESYAARPPASPAAASTPSAAPVAEPSIAASERPADATKTLGLLIVQCDVTPEAVKQPILKEILEQERLLGRVYETRPAKDAGDSDSKEHKSRSLARGMKRPASEEEASSLEFTATRDQLLAILAKLKGRPDLFVAVPEPSQLGLVAVDEKANVMFRVGKDGAGVNQKSEAALEGTKAKGRPIESKEGRQAGDQETQQTPARGYGFGTLQSLAGTASADQRQPSTYRVRIELRVVSKAGVAAEAKPAEAPVSGKP